MGMNAKKVVLKLDLHDDRDKQKAMKVVSKIPCIDLIAIDMKDRKLTVVGDVDPVNVVNRLRKHWNTDIALVGPAKEPEKKKDGGGGDKKDDGKGGGGGGGGGGDKKKGSGDQAQAAAAAAAGYNPYVVPYYYPHHVVMHNPHVTYPQQYNTAHYPPMASPYYAHEEENPNTCVIC